MSFCYYCIDWQIGYNIPGFPCNRCHKPVCKSIHSHGEDCEHCHIFFCWEDQPNHPGHLMPSFGGSGSPPPEHEGTSLDCFPNTTDAAFKVILDFLDNPSVNNRNLAIKQGKHLTKKLRNEDLEQQILRLEMNKNIRFNKGHHKAVSEIDELSEPFRLLKQDIIRVHSENPQTFNSVKKLSRTTDVRDPHHVIVDTKWVEINLKNPKVRIVEVDYDPQSSYNTGHIPGAILFNWREDINDPITRNIMSKESCQDLLRRAGIDNDTTLLLYGDFNNWFAVFAFWVFKYYGLQDIRIINGGRKKWIEEKRLLSIEVPSYPRGNFISKDPDSSIRMYFDDIKNGIILNKPNVRIIDVKGLRQNSKVK